MKVTRSTTLAGRPGEQDVTHALHWIPPYISLAAGQGHWRLQDAGTYFGDDETFPVDPGLRMDAPREASAGDLAELVCSQLGYRVDLALHWNVYQVHGRPGGGTKEPAWWVSVADYTHPGVLAALASGAGWADPADPQAIDWPARQAAAAIWFTVTSGRPVSPFAMARIRHGRNELGRWGENLAADAVVTAGYAGVRWLLMVERADGHGWAVPGGMTEAGETGTTTALRELAEETGLVVTDLSMCRPLPARHVPDPRESREAWAVTVPVRIDLGPVNALPAVTAADDAARADWVAARDYAGLEAALALDHAGGTVFAAHAPMLHELLATPACTACEDLPAR